MYFEAPTVPLHRHAASRSVYDMIIVQRSFARERENEQNRTPDYMTFPAQADHECAM